MAAVLKPARALWTGNPVYFERTVASIRRQPEIYSGYPGIDTRYLELRKKVLAGIDVQTYGDLDTILETMCLAGTYFTLFHHIKYGEYNYNNIVTNLCIDHANLDLINYMLYGPFLGERLLMFVKSDEGKDAILDDIPWTATSPIEVARFLVSELIPKFYPNALTALSGSYTDWEYSRTSISKIHIFSEDG